MEKKDKTLTNKHWFIIGIATGFLLSIFVKGTGTNSGSEFYGSEFVEVARKAARGIGTNSGSKFYSDKYIAAKFKQDKM